MIDGILGDAMKKQFNLPDWHFREIPWISQDLFDVFLEVIGKDNIKIISGGQRDNSVRASLLISPTGMEHLSQYIKEQFNASEVPEA